MSDKPMSFAEQLKAVRRREGCSQAMAARWIPGLSTRTLQAWERGQQAPPPWAQLLVLESLGGPPCDPAKKRSARSARNGRLGKHVK
ncbi:MAG: helix-turn-helix domain-containing protein [Verrucomicrobia bacterium]|nr:helix-turn-helix domain-containing protein [Verrucomicrobiota bacterium]